MIEDREVISLSENEYLCQWVKHNYNSFDMNENYTGYCTFIKNISNNCKDKDEIIKIIKNIKDRIIQKENLFNVIQCESDTDLLHDFLYYNENGSKLHLHHDFCDSIKGKIQIRFNVCIQKPEFGGRPIYAGNIIELVERNYIICRSEIDYHTSEWISGNKAKISISFGFLIDIADLHLYSNREQIIDTTNLDYFFKTWKVDSLVDINPFFDNLKLNKSYFLQTQNENNFDFLERYIHDIVLFHFNKGNLVFDKNIHFIEFFKFNTTKFITDYKKNINKTPIFTIIASFYENNAPIIFTKIDVNSYKYKEILDENKIIIYNSFKHTHILFDSSNFYGTLIDDYENSQYLKINIWESYIDSNNYYVTPFNKEINDNCFYERNNVFHKSNYLPVEFINLTNVCCYNVHLINYLLYSYNFGLIDDKINLKLKDIAYKNRNFNIIIVKNSLIEHFDYLLLHNKYGDITEDIYPLLYKNYQKELFMLKKYNRFCRSNIVKNTLSLEICQWIIKESEKINNWHSPIFPHCVKNIDLEFLPDVLTYILSTLDNFIKTIKDVYNINDDINIFNISKMYVSKYENNNINKNKNENKNNSFLTINILLNEFIIIDDKFGKKTHVLNQGDMLIYYQNNTFSRSDSNEVYFLIFVLDFNLEELNYCNHLYK